MHPLLPDLAMAGLQAIDEASFEHTAQFGTQAVIVFDNSETELGPVVWDSERTPARFTQAGAELAERAASLGVQARWSLVVPVEKLVLPGAFAMVRGYKKNHDVSWQRLVKVTFDLGIVAEIHRQLTAIDEDLY